MRTARFEQISSDGHHMSRAGGWNGGGGVSMSDVRGEAGAGRGGSV